MQVVTQRKESMPPAIEESPSKKDSVAEASVEKEQRRRPQNVRNWMKAILACILGAALRSMRPDLPPKSPLLRAKDAATDSTSRTSSADKPLAELPTSAVATSHYESRRFPQYGTSAFSEKCPWVTTELGQGEQSCTILYQPGADGTEGIAAWFSQIVQGFMVAQQAKCQFRFGHDPSVHVSQVLSSVPDFNWTMPPDLPCEKKQRCFRFHPSTFNTKDITKSIKTKRGIHRGPKYRFVYGSYTPGPHDFDYLNKSLPEFSFDTGMACSLGGLLHLAPSAAQFEPNLFTKILPTLHDPKALVMGLYIRTGNADKMASTKPGNNASTDEAKVELAHSVTRCACDHEQDLLLAEPEYTKVVWMLVSDSPKSKQWAIENYHGQNVVLTKNEHNDTSIRREIVITGSRGRHTRTRVEPSTTDFAEAFIDWYLLGESDVVFTHRPFTFGALAGLRTARPMYRDCVLASPTDKTRRS